MEGTANGGPGMSNANRTHDFLMQFFRYEHLRPDLQGISKPYCELARVVIETYPANPERTSTLRKLMEAKDCAVRAVMAGEPA